MASTSIAIDILARDHASNTFNRVGGAAGRSSGHLATMGTRLRSVAKYAGLAAGAAVVLSAKWGVDAVKAAAKDEQAQKQLAAVLKRNADATPGQVAGLEKWITKIGVATGVTDDELRPALQRLVATTKDVGKAQALTTLAMDVAAGRGKSLESVTLALEKAQNGSLGGLSRLGVKTKDAAGNTLSLQQVTKSLADTYGGAAAAKADTFQGKMDRLKLVYKETKEQIGAKLLPVLTDLATWFLNKGIPAISKTWDWLKRLGSGFAEVGGKGTWLSDALQSVKGALSDAQPFFQVLGAVMRNVILPAMSKFAAVTLPTIAVSIQIVGKALGAMGNVMKFVWNSVLAPTFRFFGAAISKVLGALGSLFGALASIPGAPAWIGKTANALHAASTQVDQLASGIRNIPDKTVHINVKTAYTYDGSYAGAQVPGGASRTTPRAPSGGRVNAGGRGWTPSVGVQAGGVSVETLQAALSGMVLKVVGLDPGQEAYLQVGGVF